MKLTTLILMLGLYGTSCKLKTITKNDSSQDDLKGKVRLVTMMSYNTIDSVDTNRFNKTIADTFITTYNENEYCIEEYSHTHNKITGIDPTKNIGKTTYQYNNSGQLVQMLLYDINNNIALKDKYNYDSNGHKAGLEMYDRNDSIIETHVFRCDDDGNIINEKRFNKDGIFFGECDYRYDDRGNKTMISDKYLKSGSKYKTRFVYDKNNLCIEKYTYDLTSDTNYLFKHIDKYDDNGNSVESQSYTFPERYSALLTTKYIYDSKGNWIQKTQLVNGRLNNLSIRIIQYY